jgi:hypothetical protein
MKTVWYILTVFFGAIGLLSLLRVIERLMLGAEMFPVQIVIALVMLVLAVVSLRKARSTG